MSYPPKEELRIHLGMSLSFISLTVNLNSYSSFYITPPSAMGTFGIVWRKTSDGPRVHRVFLPDKKARVEDLIHLGFSVASNLSCPAINKLGSQIQMFLEGRDVIFDMGMLALDGCSQFQQKVLLAEYKIPRGMVSTYGRISKRLNLPGGARAVGSALSHNPFPIIVPCHRTIRYDGQPGGFQGGQKMKRTLLELEEIEFSRSGRVITNRIYY